MSRNIGRLNLFLIFSCTHDILYLYIVQSCSRGDVRISRVKQNTKTRRQQQPRRRRRRRASACGICVVHNNNIKTIIITIIVVRAFTLFEMFTRCVISAMLQFLRNKKAFVLYKVSVRVCACVCKCTLAASV